MSQTWNKADNGSLIFTQINTAAFTGTALATLWTPTTGKSFILMGWSLSLTVTTVLAASAAFNVVMVDNALATKVGPGLGGFGATDAAGTTRYCYGVIGPTGWQSGAADRVLKMASAPATDISTGVIRVSGMVWGREI